MLSKALQSIILKMRPTVVAIRIILSFFFPKEYCGDGTTFLSQLLQSKWPSSFSKIIQLLKLIFSLPVSQEGLRTNSAQQFLLDGEQLQNAKHKKINRCLIPKGGSRAQDGGTAPGR